MASQTLYSFTDTIHNDTYHEIDPILQSDCSGKAVLVTGANKGLGRAFVLAYARAGASHIAIGSRSDASDVVVAILEAAKRAERDVPVVIQVKIDVCDQASVDASADQVRREWGRLDILINNSGFMGPPGPLIDQGCDVYMHVWDVNFWGTYRATKAFLPLMLDGGDKTVIVITSIGAQYVESGLGAYSISKLALCRFTEFIDAEYGKQGVLSYAYHPGGVVTDLALNLPKEIQTRLTDTPDLAADTLVFLTSKKRTWLAGRYVAANWDMPQLMAKEGEIVRDDLLKFTCMIDVAHMG